MARWESPISCNEEEKWAKKRKIQKSGSTAMMKNGKTIPQSGW
jgi:hypothetical protein